MYLVASAGADDVTGPLAAALSEVGDSVAVVGDEGLWQAHVHTDTPLEAVAAAAVTGTAATQIRVRHLVSQSGVHGAHRPRLGLVAVTAAPALTADLARAGAVVVLVPEGRPAGPELARAVDDTGAHTVLVLAADGFLEGAPDRGPDGPRVRRIRGLSEVQVVVGAATLASLDPGLGEDRLAEAVSDAVDAVRVADVGAAGDAVAAAEALLDRPTTLLTVLTSAGTPEDVVSAVVEVARSAGVEVVVLPTGRPGDAVVLGAE